MKRTHTIILLLVITFCFTSMPMEVMGSATTENEETRLTLKNIGKKKTLYQYLEFTIKTNVDSAKCQFRSSDKKIATVNKKGVITAKKKGSTTITVKYGNQKKKIKLTVKKSGNKYSPQRVAKIANQRMKRVKNSNSEKYTYMPDKLKEQLENGEITQEVYDESYPNFGGGNYLIIYYRMSLEDLWSLGAKRLKTESDIANNIIGYYKASDWNYYYVDYMGKQKRNNKMYYVFHLYN